MLAGCEEYNSMTMALPFVFEWQQNKLWLKLQNYYVILTLDFRQESAHSFEILIVILGFNCASKF